MASRISASAVCVSPACNGGLQFVQVEPRAEVGEQQEALRHVLLEHARRVQPGVVQQRGDGDEGSHVLLRRRRVHDDAAARRWRCRCAGSGESWRRWRRCAASPGPARGARRCRPASVRRPRGAPGRPRRWQGSREMGSRRCGPGRLVDNRFYKPPRRHADALHLPDARADAAAAVPRSHCRTCPRCASFVPAAARLRRTPLRAGARRRWAWCARRPSAPAEAAVELRTATELQPLPRGERHASAADHPAGARAARPARPGDAGRGRRRVPPRRPGDPRRPPELRPRRRPGAGASGKVRISRDGNVYSGPELQLQRAALRGLLPRADLPLRAHRRGRHGASASTSSTSSAPWPPAPPTPAARATAPAGRPGC